MTALNNMIMRAKSAPKHVVLAEGHDARIIEASVKAVRDNLATITLLGTESDIRPLTQAAGDSENAIAIIDPQSTDKMAAYSEAFFELRKHKGITITEAQKAIQKPLNFANMMVRQGEADGSVAGAIHTTSDVVRSAIKIIGVNQNYTFVSSLFIMLMAEDSKNLKGGVIYSDCGLVIDPDEKQLAEIASAASENAKALLDIDPKVVLLSFATQQSAQHADVDKMRNATELLKAKHPDLSVDGPLQFDAAIMASVAASKAPHSKVAGQANVFIFPDLNAGNIAYKITERLAGAKAIGPILQGLNKPANDLSRGCDAEAIYNMIAVTVLQSQAQILAE